MYSNSFRRRIVEEELSALFREFHKDSIKLGLVPEEEEMPLARSKGFLEFFGGIITGGLLSVIAIWLVFLFIILFYK